MELLPTVYGELVGAYVEEYNPIGYDKAKVRLQDGSVYECKQWCDILVPESAEPVAFYDSEYYKGKPAILENWLKTALHLPTVMVGALPLE